MARHGRRRQEQPRPDDAAAAGPPGVALDPAAALPLSDGALALLVDRIMAADRLATLTDRSLVTVSADDPPRYRRCVDALGETPTDALVMRGRRLEPEAAQALAAGDDGS